MVSLFKKLARAGAVVTALCATNAAAQDVIEQDGYADDVANYLLDNCPTTESDVSPESTQACIQATLTATYSVASHLSDFITEAKIPTMPLQAGMSNGELLRGCEWTAQAVSNQKYSNNLAFLTATADFARSCIPSIRRAADKVGLDWEPTAVNTLANQVNCLTGNGVCYTVTGTGRPQNITVQP